ncbi:MAG: hypothetical protein H7255_08885 [Ramlibacter sp.]|nr:hypothetical protein [Ramlibacter sp.]
MQSGVFPWVVESRGAPLRSDNGWFAQVAIRDEVLRPTHDPGDDAQDETLAWLPSPAKQGEPA